jgi:PilZ domain
MIERRAFPRRRVFKGAMIAFGQSTSVNCIVRNISLGGACLELDCAIGIPRAFTLVMTADRTRHPSRIIWASGKRLGIAFQ